MAFETRNDVRIGRLIKSLLLLPLAIVLSSCAATTLTTLPPSHPANPYAQEAAVNPRTYNLQSDSATKRTHDLLTSKKKSSDDEKSSDKNKGSDTHMNHGGM